MREKFLETIMAEGLDEASRAEEGNIKYDYYIPTDGSSDLFLLEKWRDKEALSEHMQTPHLKRLAELKADYVNETIIERYEA